MPGAQHRLGIGLKHDANQELDQDRRQMRLRPTRFSWRSHLDKRYAGYRIYLDASLDELAPVAAATPADTATRAMQRARLLATD